MKKVLVLNSGSSSIKYQLFDMDEQTVFAAGYLERIGQSQSQLCHETRNSDGQMQATVHDEPVANHRRGIQLIGAALAASDLIRGPQDLYGIGHRVVHGGDAFKEPTRIDEQVLATIRKQIPLAPLHNPANISGIEVARTQFPDVPQVAVFDTAFHQTIPPYAYHYAIPRQWYTAHRARRYGFHGTSHCYVADRAAKLLGQPLESLNLIVLHLGNGASAAAIERGKSVDTSMGMTPLEGLIMGTRCGDIDPALAFHLARVSGQSNDQLESILNKESGLQGICGKSDMREVVSLAESHDESARLAIEMVAYRIKKYIGAYAAALGQLDALIFTAGIGENCAAIREKCCHNLMVLGIAIDLQKNQLRSDRAREIQTADSPVKVLIVPTDEELQIAVETVQCIQCG